MGFAPLVLMAASTAISTASAIQQGKEQKAWMDYQGAQAQADARAARDAAMVQADLIRKMGRRQASEARAALAGSGVSVDEGTALNINQGITAGAEEDAVMTIFNGKNQAARLDAEAQGAYLRGDAAWQAGKLNAHSSLLAGAEKILSGWRRSPSAENQGSQMRIG